MDDLHLSEISQKVSVEVHVEFPVVVEGQSQLVLLVIAYFPPLTVPENISLIIFNIRFEIFLLLTYSSDQAPLHSLELP